jgi:hypothetical protein
VDCATVQVDSFPSLQSLVSYSDGLDEDKADFHVTTVIGWEDDGGCLQVIQGHPRVSPRVLYIYHLSSFIHVRDPRYQEVQRMQWLHDGMSPEEVRRWFDQVKVWVD